MNTDDASAEDTPRTARWGLVAVLAVVALVGVGLVSVLGGGTGSDRDPDDAVFDPSAIEAPPTLGEFADALEQLPPSVLANFDGDGTTQITDLLGAQPLIVNFWATWCAPCVAEMPELQQLSDAAGDDLRLVGINTQDSPLNAEPFAEDLQITYDLLVDPDGAYFEANNSFGMPTTLFVSPDGAIRWRQTGPMTIDQMVELTAEHLGVQVDVGPA